MTSKRHLPRAFFGSAAAWLALLVPAPAQADSLLAALTDTYGSNQQIAAERAAVEGKDELVPEAKSNLWRPHVFFEPQADVSWTSESITDTFPPTRPHAAQNEFTQNNDNNAKDRLLQLNATMNVFDSGLTAAQLRQAEALIDAERGILEQTEEQVFQNVASQYGQIVLNQLLVQAALETKQDSQTLRTVVSSLQQQHFVTVTSVSQVEQLYQSSIAAYEQAAGAERAARAQFLALVGRPAGKIDGWPTLKPMAGALPPAFKIAMTANPQLFTARAELAAAKAAVDSAKAQMLPVVSAFGTLSNDWNKTHFTGNNTAIPSGLPPYFSVTNNDGATVGLRMTMPLYQGGGDYANVRQQLDAVLQNQHALISTEASVRAAVDAAWQTVEASRAQYAATTAQVTDGRQVVEGMKRQFSDGTETITNVLTEERNLSSALTADAQAGYAYFTAVVAFDVAIGRFNAKDLALHVKLYDPLDHYQAVKNKLFGFGSN